MNAKYTMNPKQVRNIFALAVVVMAGCVKEVPPPGLVLDEGIETKDTTYITAAIPAAQTKNVLFEEASGVHCTNCPDGAELLAQLKVDNPNRILSATVYSPFLNEFKPPQTKHDFNTQDAEDLVDFLGSEPPKPSSTIDRLLTGNSIIPYFFNKEDWPAKVNELLIKTTPLNIDLQSLKDGENYVLKSKITFTDTITAELAISVYLIEDGIIDYQLDNGVDVDDYEHNHVLVDILTPLSGSVFLNDVAQKEKGRVFERSFIYQLPSNVVNKANCHLLCFVHKTGGIKEVLHVEEVHLN
jgi:hypothetical protein